MLRHVDVDMVVRTRRETMEQSEAMSVHRPTRGRGRGEEGERERKGERGGGTEEGYGRKGDRKRDGERKTVKSCARV